MTSKEYYNNCDEKEKGFIKEQIKEFYYNRKCDFFKELEDYSVEELQELLEMGSDYY